MTPEEKERAFAFARAAKAREAAQMPQGDKSGLPAVAAGANFERALMSRQQLDDQDRQMQQIRDGRTQQQKDDHAASLTLRMATENAPQALTIPGTMAADALRAAGYGVKKLTGAIGLTDPPDQKNWYPGGEREGWLPVTTQTGDALAKAADKMGLDRPETQGERDVNTYGGAVMGLGAGLAAKGLPLVGKALSANPVAQTVSTLGATAAADVAAKNGFSNPAITLAAIAGGATPAIFSKLPGRQSVHTKEGRDWAARNVLLEAADEKDPAKLITSARENRENIKVPGFNRPGENAPGFQLNTGNATKDRGLASIQTKLDEWSNANDTGGAAQVARQNEDAVKRGLIAMGGESGTADNTLATQRSRDATAIDDMNLSGDPYVNVTALREDLRKRSSGRETNDNRVAEANKLAREKLDGISTPILGDKGEVIGYQAAPEGLKNLRQELSETSWEAKKAGRSGEAKTLRDTQKKVLDPILNDETNDRWGQYLKESQGGRRVAEEQSFMERLREKAEKPNGLEKVASAVGNDAPLKTATGGTISASGLNEGPVMTPGRKEFVEALRQASEAEQWGPRNTGRDAVNRRELNTSIMEEAKAGQTPWERSSGFMRQLADKAAYPINAATGGMLPQGVVGNAGRLVASAGLDLKSIDKAATEVGKRVGAAGQSGPVFEEVMNATKPYNPGWVASAIANAERTARIGGAQGFMAGERVKRYR